MEKKRSFLLATYIALFFLLIIASFCWMYGGLTIGYKATFLPLFIDSNMGLWWLIPDSVLSFASGLSILFTSIFIPICGLLLLITFILFIFSGRAKKLVLPVYILTFLTTAATIAVVGTLFALCSAQAFENMISLILYATKYEGYSWTDDHYGNLTHLYSVMYIGILPVDAALHMLLGPVFLVFWLLTAIPGITFIVAFVLGIISCVKAKKAKKAALAEQLAE